MLGYDRILIFWFDSSGTGEDVEEDREDVPDKESRRAEGNHGLNRGEPHAVTKRKRGSEAQCAEDEGY